MDSEKISHKIKQLGNICSSKRENPNPGRVYDSNALCPALTNMQGGVDNHTLWK